MPGLRAGNPRPTGMAPSPPASRTVEVLYLLSRRAKLEHPHMINVHYAAHQPGPTLNDLKARLIALRGKGMPDSFAWSYKRNYKDTFIWCDLFNDDLILPLTESGEYVLKATKLFDVDVAPQDGELEYGDEVVSPLLPIRNSSPSAKTSSSRLSSHLDEEDNISIDIKESLLLNNVPQAGDITCSSGTVTNFLTSPNLGANHQEHQCNTLADSQTSHRELASKNDIVLTTDHCKLEFATVTNSTRDHEMRTPARRRSSEKEIDKSTIYTQFVHHKNHGDKVQGSEACSSGSTGLCVSNPDQDPFLFGVLRKATRLGSNFRPRLCRGVDVVDSTRTKTKVKHYRRTRTANDSNQCRVKQPRPVNNTELSSKNSGSTSVTRSYSCFTSPEKSSKGFKTLHEYFDTKERISSSSPTPVDKLINEVPHSVDDSHHAPRPTHLGSAPEDSSAGGASDLPQEKSPDGNDGISRRPFRNEARETMKVQIMAKLPSSRGACRVMPQREGYKSGRSESKGNKQEVKLHSKSTRDSKMSSSGSSSSRQLAGSKPASYEHNGFLHRSCSVHGMDDPIVVRTPDEIGARNVTTASSRQRRPVVKKASVLSFGASTVSCRSKATSAGSNEKTMKAPRNASTESAASTLDQDPSKPLPESFAFDSRAMRSGNKQGLKNMATQVVPATSKVEALKAAAEAIPNTSSNEGPKRWPFEPPARPRDFKSREDRPLVPGLSSKDWERSFQEACRQSEPPTNLILHECSQCGRTFKLESLQVHLRGCRAVNKPRPSLATQRRVSI